MTNLHWLPIKFQYTLANCYEGNPPFKTTNFGNNYMAFYFSCAQDRVSMIDLILMLQTIEYSSGIHWIFGQLIKYHNRKQPQLNVLLKFITCRSDPYHFVMDCIC